MTTQNGHLVLSRKCNEIIVVRHGGEQFLIQIKERNSLTLQAPDSIRIIRGELVSAKMPGKGYLVLSVTPQSGLVIDHAGERLKISFSVPTRVVCHGPRSFDVVREDILDEPMAA